MAKKLAIAFRAKDEVLSGMGIGPRRASGIGHRAYLTFLRTVIYEHSSCFLLLSYWFIDILIKAN